MAYPPVLPPSDRTDSTLMAGAHSSDHNTIALAFADFLAELGANPAGAYADLTSRLADMPTSPELAEGIAAAELARDQAQAAAASAAAPTDAQVAALVPFDSGSASSRVIADLIASSVGGFEAPAWSALATVTVIPIGVLDDGYLYGRDGTILKRSLDSGATWATVQDLGATGGLILGVRDAGDGEVIVIREAILRRSTGWAANPATATWATVLTATGVSSFYAWGVSANPATGVLTATTYVGTPPVTDSRYLWVSVDSGATWAIKYDLAAHVDNTTNHLHFTCIDPWADDRIWASYHQVSVAGAGVVMFSDDLGDTWTTLAVAQPTVAVATPGGIVFGSDEAPNGVYVVSRTTDPADMVYRLAYRWNAGTGNAGGFAQGGHYDPVTRRAWLAFIGDVGYKPIIVQSDGVSASLAYESATAIDTVLGDGWRSIHVQGRTVVAVERRGAVYKTMTARAPLARRNDVAPTADPGVVLGGVANKDRATAAGDKSSAGARSVAIGYRALATTSESVVIGVDASAVASGSTVIGRQAATLGVNTVAIGYLASAGSGELSMAVGQSASAEGSWSTAIGGDASANGTRATSVGRQASATGAGSTALGGNTTAATFSTAVGSEADASADLATVVGKGTLAGVKGTVVGALATVTGSKTYGTVLGYDAHVGHDRSVALGSLVTTTAPDQVAVGGRHFEIFEVIEPNAPAADGARLYVKDNGSGKSQLCIRFATGAVQVIATQP